jgi:predicted glycosyltransferase involved in capsule biosynthesis
MDRISFQINISHIYHVTTYKTIYLHLKLHNTFNKSYDLLKKNDISTLIIVISAPFGKRYGNNTTPY